MSVESATTLATLEDLWPLAGDFVSEGDDHLRLIKSVLKAQFPGAAGDGLASPITATEAELNTLVGVTSDIQTQIDAIYQFPAGTAVLFYQALAPTGWTQVNVTDASTHYMVRVIGTGETGGTYAGDYDLASHDFTHSHGSNSTSGYNLSPEELPDMDVKIYLDELSDGDEHHMTTMAARGRNGATPVYYTIGRMISGSALGEVGEAHAHFIADDVKSTFPLYADFIVCTKDA